LEVVFSIALIVASAVIAAVAFKVITCVSVGISGTTTPLMPLQAFGKN